MTTTKVLPVAYSITNVVKKGLVQQEQDNEKEETPKKSNETRGEKDFTYLPCGENIFYLHVVQTQHNTSYLNNYKSYFYGLLSTPPPDVSINVRF